MCMTATYLESLLDELRGGNDLGVIILTVADCDDGSEVEMYSNLNAEGTTEIMQRMSDVEISGRVMH